MIWARAAAQFRKRECQREARQERFPAGERFDRPFFIGIPFIDDSQLANAFNLELVTSRSQVFQLCIGNAADLFEHNIQRKIA